MKKTIVALIIVTVLLLSITVAVSADTPPGVAPAIKFVDADYGCWETLDEGLYCGYFTYLYPNSASGHITIKAKMELIEGPPLHDVFKFNLTDYYGYDCRIQAVFSGKNMSYYEQCFPTD